MSLVLDQFDPSGMFSKAGRISLEMFQIIQQKNEILYGKKQYYDKYTEDLPPIFQKKPKNKVINEIKTDQKLKKNTFHKEPFAKMISREQIQALKQGEKIQDKRFGMYRPRYNLIFKKSPLYLYENANEDEKQKKKQNNKSKKLNIPEILQKNSKNQIPISQSVETMPDLPVFNSIKSSFPIPLSKQLSRKDIFLTNLNEKRFEFISLPSISSKFHKTVVPNLKYGGRSVHNSVFASSRSGLEYKPKFGLVLPNDALMIPNFEKSVSRKDNTHVSYTLNETYIEEDSIGEGSYKIRGPKFEKMTARE